MKFILPIGLFLSLYLFSCGSSSIDASVENNSEQPDTTKVDSVIEEVIEIEVDPNRNVIDVEKLFSKAKTTFELPLKIDSTFLEKHAVTGEESRYNLSSEEAKHLGFSFPNDANLSSSESWQIRKFIQIDSFKQINKYEEYLAGLDIGQTKYAIANVFGKVKVNDITEILLWSTDYATYEACPYGYGTYIFGTIFTNFTATQTTILAQKSGGGDPPAWGDDYLESEITDSTIAIYRLEKWGAEDYDTGEEYTEKREMRELLELSPYGLKVLEKDSYDY